MAVLVLLAVAFIAIRLATGHDYLMGLAPMFSLTEEQNVPTFFSTSLLLLASALLAATARDARSGRARDPHYWWGLSAIFALLSLDEMGQLHERLIAPFRQLLGSTDGVLYYAWVVPVLAFVAVVALIYSRFLTRLPRRTAMLFLVAGAIYVGGAAGGEMLEGLSASRGMRGTMTIVIITLLEETLEMVGVVVFIYAILDHLASRQQAPVATSHAAHAT